MLIFVVLGSSECVLRNNCIPIISGRKIGGSGREEEGTGGRKPPEYCSR